jgi:hypothetical protein
MDELQPITNVLDEYQSNKLFSLDLRRDLIGQDPSFDTYQEIDDNGDLPEDVKQMEIEGKFLNTLDYDLISYEVRLTFPQLLLLHGAPLSNISSLDRLLTD